MTDDTRDLTTPPEEKALPCPFCGETDIEMNGAPFIDVYLTCMNCLAHGPVATIGCRDEEEDGSIDLEEEAVELWNARAPVQQAPNVPAFAVKTGGNLPTSIGTVWVGETQHTLALLALIRASAKRSDDNAEPFGGGGIEPELFEALHQLEAQARSAALAEGKTELEYDIRSLETCPFCAARVEWQHQSGDLEVAVHAGAACRAWLSTGGGVRRREALHQCELTGKEMKP